MNTLITLCRDIEEPTSTDCREDHEAMDVTLVAPCKVARDKCAHRPSMSHLALKRRARRPVKARWSLRTAVTARNAKYKKAGERSPAFDVSD